MATRLFIFLFISQLIRTCLSANFYDTNKHIVELNNHNFDRFVKRSNYTTLVEFYAPWCGHCRKLEKDFRKVGRALEGLVQVGAVNCDDSKNKALCGEYQIEGFPTLMVFKPTKGKSGANSKEVYQGPREVKSIVDFCVSRIKNHVHKVADLSKLVTYISSEKRRNRSRRYSVMLVSDKSKVSPLYKAMAIDWSGLVDFYYVNRGKVSGVTDTKSKIGEALGDLETINANSSGSYLLLLDMNDDVYYVYDVKPFSKKGIAEFLHDKTGLAPNEGPLSPRQEIVDAFKEGRKVKRTRKIEDNIHDEL